MEEAQRVAGEGTLEQVRADLAALQSLGADYVLFHTYTDDPEATRHHETMWRMYTGLAENAVDLPRNTLK
jgi:hypothetical protein